MTTGSAPAKAILLGEHSVVYGRPALAVPLDGIRVSVSIKEAETPNIHILSVATGSDLTLQSADPSHPLAQIVRLTLDELQSATPSLNITIDSTIPIAAGLGSGAAVSVAIVRALAEHLGRPLSAEKQAQLAFEVDKSHHGTPSGIDNTVIAYGSPIRFVRDAPVQKLALGARLHLVIGDSGITSPTSHAVEQVRKQWLAEPVEYERIFDAISEIVGRAEPALARGDVMELGSLMSENQVLLERMGVSHPKLERMIQASMQAGSLGAKLSGGGMGGVMLALVESEQGETVRDGLLVAGASQVLVTEVNPDLP
jgi:mevalonate kinase